MAAKILYLWKRCLGRFWHAGCYYLWIVLELAAESALLICQDSVGIAAGERLAAYERQFRENSVSIMSYRRTGSGRADSELPITYEDYCFFRQKYSGEVELHYIQYGSIFAGEYIAVLGLSQDKFRQLTGCDMQEEALWIGEDAAKKLQDRNGYVNPDCRIEGETIRFFGQQFSYHILKAPLNESIINFDSGAGSDLLTAKCIFLPIDTVPELTNVSFFQSTLEVEGESFRETAEEMAGYLEEKRSGYSYQTADRRQIYISNSRDFKRDIDLLGWIGNFALLLTITGITGIMLIHLEERKKDFAVSLVVGNTMGGLVAETLAELFLVCLTGGLLGGILALFVMPALSNSQYLVTFRMHSAVLLLGLILGMTVLISGVLLFGTERKSPLKMLRESAG